MNEEFIAATDDLVNHIGRMLDTWAELQHSPDQRNRELWTPLHSKADRVRELLDSAKASV